MQKLKKLNKPKPSMPDPGGRRGAKVEIVEGVWNGIDKVHRIVDTIDAMHRRHQIDDLQHAAAIRFRRAYEGVECTIKSSLNVSLTPRTPGPRTPTPQALLGAESLHQARRLLGVIDGLIIEMVAGQGMSIEQATIQLNGGDANGRPREDDQRLVGKRLREALTVLAFRWFGPDRRRKSEVFRPAWARPEIIGRFGEANSGNAT